jgi:sugar phosphate isomerase/epimerase
MNLTISTLVCPKWTLPQICETASAAGVQGIDFRGLGEEIDITKLPHFNEGLAETLAMLRLHNLQMPCLNTSVTLVTPAPERWQMMLEEAQRTAALAEKTHTRYLRVFGGGVPKDLSRDEAAVLARRHARQLSKMCAGYGCIPILETHDDWSTGAQVLELVHEFDPQEIGILWDVEHPYRRGEAPADSYNTMKRFIRHVHFKDSVRIDNKNSPRLLGEGELPLKQFITILRENNYDGWICLETEKRWHAEAPEPEVSIPQFAAYMRAL